MLMDLFCHDIVEQIACDFSFSELVIVSHVNQHLRNVVQQIVHRRIYYPLFRIFQQEEHVRQIFHVMQTLRIVLAGTFPMHVLDHNRFKNKNLLLTLVTPKENYIPLLCVLQKTAYCHITAQDISTRERKSIRHYAILTTICMDLQRYKVCSSVGDLFPC